MEIQKDGETKREINRRLGTTKRALNSTLWSRDIKFNTKKIIYKTLTKSILLYGADTWTINKANVKKLLPSEINF